MGEGVLVGVGVGNCTTSKERGVDSSLACWLFVTQNASPDPKTSIVPKTQKPAINRPVIIMNKNLELFLFNLTTLWG